MPNYVINVLDEVSGACWKAVFRLEGGRTNVGAANIVFLALGAVMRLVGNSMLRQLLQFYIQQQGPPRIARHRDFVETACTAEALETGNIKAISKIFTRTLHFGVFNLIVRKDTKNYWS